MCAELQPPERRPDPAGKQPPEHASAALTQDSCQESVMSPYAMNYTEVIADHCTAA